MALNRQELTDDFFAMIRKLNRTGNDILLVRDFFWKVSEIRSFTPPTVEFLNVLRSYNPTLFHEFKSSLVPNSSMSWLSTVHMDAGEALQSLGIRDVVHLMQSIKGLKE